MAVVEGARGRAPQRRNLPAVQPRADSTQNTVSGVTTTALSGTAAAVASTTTASLLIQTAFNPTTLIGSSSLETGLSATSASSYSEGSTTQTLDLPTSIVTVISPTDIIYSTISTGSDAVIASLSSAGKLIVIISSSLGGVFVMLLFIGAICCVRRRSKKKMDKLILELAIARRKNVTPSVPANVHAQPGCRTCGAYQCSGIHLAAAAAGKPPEDMATSGQQMTMADVSGRRKSLHEQVESTNMMERKFRQFRTLRAQKKERASGDGLLEGSLSKVSMLHSSTRMGTDDVLPDKSKDWHHWTSQKERMGAKELGRREDEPIMGNLLLERKRENEKFLVLPEPAYARAVRPEIAPPMNPG
jgi:hypothetical protein